MLAFALLAALLLPAASASAPAAAGLEVTVSQDAVNSVVQRALPPLLHALNGLVVPEETGTKKVPLLGDVDYWITDLTIQDMTMADASVSLEKDVSVEVSGVSLQMTANWKYKERHGLHLESDGSADLSMSDSGLSLVLLPGDVGGRLALKTGGVDVRLDNVEVEVHGSILSWLYDLIIDVAKRSIVDKTEAAVAAALVQAVDVGANQALARVNYTFPVGQGVGVANFSLAAAPAFPKDYLLVSLVAAVESPSGVAPPLPRHELPDDTPDRYLGLLVDEYLVNSALYELYKSGAVAFPPVTGPALVSNSSALALVAPGLARAFPNAPLRVQLDVFAAPSVEVSAAAGAALEVKMGLSWDALAADGQQWRNAFVVGSNLTFAATFSAENGNATASPYLNAKVTALDLDLEQLSSNCGPLKFDAVSVLLKALVLEPVTDFLNKILARGVPLPALPGGVQLVRPEVSEQDGYLYVATDF